MYRNQSWRPVITPLGGHPCFRNATRAEQGGCKGWQGRIDIVSIRFYIEIGIILLVYVILFYWVICALAVFICVEPQFSPFAQPSRLQEAHLLT
jgi:hypothetical protein